MEDDGPTFRRGERALGALMQAVNAPMLVGHMDAARDVAISTLLLRAHVDHDCTRSERFFQLGWLNRLRGETLKSIG